MTTSEIAERLHLSRGTVSRVLNNHPNVKAETRRRVLEEMARLGYGNGSGGRPAGAFPAAVTRRLAVIAFSEPAFFWAQIRGGVEAVAAELRPLGVLADFFCTDIRHPEEQADLLRGMPDRGYDAVAIAPYQSRRLLEEVDRLTLERRMPVIFFHTDIPTANRLCYVGGDYIQSGALTAELLAKFLQGSGAVCVYTQQDQTTPMEERMTGFRRELQRYPGLRIQEIRRFSHRGEGVYESTADLLQNPARCPDLRGIFVSFDGLEETARAVEELGMGGKIQLIGCGFSPDIARYLREGIVSAVVCQEPFQQGYLAVKLLHILLSNGPLPTNTVIHTKPEVVMRSNVDDLQEPADHGPAGAEAPFPGL